MKTTTRLLAVLLLIAFSGCTGFRQRTLPAPQEAPVSLRAARVTPRTGTMVVLRNVQVTADSVTGWSAGDPDPSGLLRGRGERVAVHRDQVLVYEPAGHNYWATAGGALLAGLVVVLYLVSNADP